MINKRTKIVATISSLNCGVELVQKLYDAGMDVARLNTAHITTDEAMIIVKNIRQVSESIAIMVDTKGPNVRVCNLTEPLPVTEGQTVLVSTKPVESGKGFQVSYNRFCDEVKIGQSVLVDDGTVDLLIVERKGDALVCTAAHDCMVKDKKSVNVPGAELNTPALTKKDRDFIEFAIANRLDFIAHSFVRNRDDVMALQSILDTNESPIRIIAKIENRQGVTNLDDILEVAYGIMVARGDLGIEIPVEEVPLIQKRIIYSCMRRHKPVITATQMLQSMETSSRPTRAEVSDIANAVMDGTDAVMLSGETANGKYPVESVEMMSRIIQETEKSPDDLFIRADKDKLASDEPVRDTIVYAAVECSRKLPVKGIVCNTSRGTSANMCAAYRGKVPIFGLTYDNAVFRQLALTYGIRPVLMPFIANPHDLLQLSLEMLMTKKWIDQHDLVVMVGQFAAESPTTDLFSIVRPCNVLT